MTVHTSAQATVYLRCRAQVASSTSYCHVMLWLPWLKPGLHALVSLLQPIVWCCFDVKPLGFLLAEILTLGYEMCASSNSAAAHTCDACVCCTPVINGCSRVTTVALHNLECSFHDRQLFCLAGKQGLHSMSWMLEQGKPPQPCIR